MAMSAKIFRISGQVIEAQTRQGIFGLRVEAWDKDEKYPDLLGVDTTDGEGNFQISFDETYFREYYPETAPDVFFKVYEGDNLIKSTADSVLVNVSTETKATIEVDLPEETIVGEDRVTARQAFRAADFMFKSDFRGVWQETTGKVRVASGFLTDMVKNSLTKMDIPPLKPSPRKMSEVVNRDVSSAREYLAGENISVNEVLPYNPRLDTASLTDIRTFPVRLSPGQKVNLYEENGVVRYYRIVPEPPEAAVAVEVTRLGQEMDQVKARVNEVEQMKSQVEEVRAAAMADRDTFTKEMTAVKTQLTTVEELKKQIADLQAESSRKDQAIKKLQEEVTAIQRRG
jgi:hypothetical protein